MFLCNIRIYVTCLFIFATALKQAWGQVGIVYSPFVREADNPGTKSYSRDDIKVMLKLVASNGYNKVTTYGVGAAGVYKRGETWKQSASIVHTAAAAAEVNNENHGKNLTLYQGLFHSKDDSTEINVGFEVATLANNIYPGTVEGMIYPSDTTLAVLLENQDKVLNVSSRAKSSKIQFGTRISDCSNLLIFVSEPSRAKILQSLDFILCQILPTTHHINEGPEKFLSSTIVNTMKDARRAIQDILGSNNAFKIILETGWPGGESLKEINANVATMLKFWDLTKQWSQEENQQIFMHEAFDIPWKKQIGALTHPQYFGRWVASETSKNAYKLKEAKVSKQKQSKDGLSKELIIGIVFGVVLFGILILFMLFLYRRVKNKFKIGNKLTEDEIREFMEGIVTNEVVRDDGGDTPWTKVAYNQEFELPKQKFAIDRAMLLGSGAFGSVYKGHIDGLVNDVAFKMTHPDCPISALKGLLSEIKILIYLGKHENIVSICGAYTSEIRNGIVYVATELCSNGSLEKFLRANKPNYVTLNELRYVNVPSSLHPNGQSSDFQLIRWALEISSAMEYISSKNVIHADLAARNILLTLDLTAKVTDFGLSRRLYEYTEYVKKQQEPLPWRWMAIESLRRLEFSVWSDVWSYGVLLWEIFSLGDIPYPGLTWDVNFVSQLENGLRPQQPTRAPEQVYDLMQICWNIEPTCRPAFSTIKDTLMTLNIQLRKLETESSVADS